MVSKSRDGRWVMDTHWKLLIFSARTPTTYKETLLLQTANINALNVLICRIYPLLQKSMCISKVRNNEGSAALGFQASLWIFDFFFEDWRFWRLPFFFFFVPLMYLQGQLSLPCNFVPEKSRESETGRENRRMERRRKRAIFSIVKHAVILSHLIHNIITVIMGDMLKWDELMANLGEGFTAYTHNHTQSNLNV